MALEKEINVFLRLQNPQVIERLRQDFPAMQDPADPREVFLNLRKLRNDW